MKNLLSVIILTFNEEVNLPACLMSLKKLNPNIFVVDSNSTDRTIEIAKQCGAEVMSHSFQNHAEQFNWAIDNLRINTPWCMRLDADERLTDSLIDELKTRLPATGEMTSGFLIKRRVYFLGRWIKHGGYYPVWLLRIWRTGKGRCENRNMDEHILISQGICEKLDNDFMDENQKGLTFWTEKHNHYATREVQDLLTPVTDRLGSQPHGQAGIRRLQKNRFYAKTPLFIRAFLYWAYRYILLLGFLDGRPGLIFHFLQAFWYRFLVDAKIYEIQKK